VEELCISDYPFSEAAAKYLEALAVVLVADCALRSCSASCGSGPSLSTTLTVLGLSGGGGSGGWGGSRYSSGTASGVGRADVTELDIGESDGSVGFSGFDSGGDPRRGGAGSTSNTWGGGGGGGGVVAVEPEHVHGMVVPNGEDEDHSRRHSLGHVGKTTLVLEVCGVAERRLLVVTVCGGDRIVSSGHSWDIDLGVLDDNTVLDIQAADFLERSGSSSSVGDELSNNSEFLGSVDGLASAVEVRGSHAEGVEVATIGIANAGIAARGTASVARANCLTADGTRVRGEGSCVVVCFPDIHLVTA